MSLPFSKFVPISAVVQSPAFTVEKKHMLLAMTSPLIGSGEAYRTYSGPSALTNFRADFGTQVPEYQAVQKYFGFLSKNGISPDKLIVARWYKTSAAPFLRGTKVTSTVAELKSIASGSFGLTMDGHPFEVVTDLSSITSYTDVAALIQTAIRGEASAGEAWANATVTYNTLTSGFIVQSGASGKGATISAVTAGTTGTDISGMLGLADAVLSQGVNAETYAEFCDRVYHANSGGYSITTLEDLDISDIEPAVAWLQGSVGNQTINTMVRLVFNMTDKATAKTLQATLAELSYTGYVVCYDPNHQYVNVLDCAICAAIDYNAANGAINFNFQPAVGYTPITNVGDVLNYQQGITNMSIATELDELKISYVYSVGVGQQIQVLYGMGLIQGDFGTEDIQVNESALEVDLQTTVVNGFVGLNKLKLQGDDAREFMATMVTPCFERAQVNGSIAYNGILSDTDRSNIFSITNNDAAADAVANNGYYFQIAELTAADIAARQVRMIVCYLCGGVVNVLRINNNIYGA